MARGPCRSWRPLPLPSSKEQKMSANSVNGSSLAIGISTPAPLPSPKRCAIKGWVAAVESTSLLKSPPPSPLLLLLRPPRIYAGHARVGPPYPPDMHPTEKSAVSAAKCTRSFRSRSSSSGNSYRSLIWRLPQRLGLRC